MTGTVIKYVRKNENGYEECNGIEPLVKGMKIIDYLNKYYGKTQDRNATDVVIEFFAPTVSVVWQYDYEENAYFSKYEDGTITGDAFKIIRTIEW